MYCSAAVHSGRAEAGTQGFQKVAAQQGAVLKLTALAAPVLHQGAGRHGIQHP